MDSSHTVDTPPVVTLDGEPLGDQTFRLIDSLGAPFARAYLREERLFDIEVWIDGTLRHMIPRASPCDLPPVSEPVLV